MITGVNMKRLGIVKQFLMIHRDVLDHVIVMLIVP